MSTAANYLLKNLINGNLVRLDSIHDTCMDGWSFT